MTISEIYRNYKLMPSLQLHQFRVAAVANYLARKAGLQSDLPAITTAALLHDMGNIIKFDLSLFPEFLEPEGLKYWQKVKDDFIDKYGKDENNAKKMIALEIGIKHREMELLESIGFTKTLINSQQVDLAKKIVCYADHRVAPTGVISFVERIRGGHKRFQVNRNIPAAQITEYDRVFTEQAAALSLLETQIFTAIGNKLKPEDITDETITPIITELKSFEINTTISPYFCGPEERIN